MKKLLCYILLLLLILPAMACADVLAPDWQAAALDDLLAAQTLLANEISARRAADQPAAEKIELSGTGTSILSGIQVAVSPVRVIFSSDSDAKLTLSGGVYDHVFRNDSSGTTIDFLDDIAEYSAMIESSGNWSIAIEPIAPGESLPYSGQGESVSDFFDLQAPVIVVVSWDATGSQSWAESLYIRLHHQYSNISSWDRDTLVSEFPLEKTGSMEVILKPTKGRTEYCFSVETGSDVKWSIAPKQ